MVEKRLTGKTIIGYGFGAVSDAASYNFVLTYVLFYLTTVAGVGAVKAGLIISVSTIIQAVMGLVVGPISDNSRNKYGRRRPLILVGGILLFVSLALMFQTFDMGDGLKFVYYLITISLFWMAYMIFLVPYNALGSEMTLDYDERTKLRTPATVFNCLGNIVGMSLPLTLVAVLASGDSNDPAGWSRFGVLLGAVCLLFILMTWRSTRGKELPAEDLMAVEKDKNPIKTYWEIIKLKPFKWVVGFAVFFYIGYIAFQSGMTYYVLYCVGLTEAQFSTVLLISVFIGIVITVVSSALSTALDKRITMSICFLIGTCGFVLLHFIGVHSFGMMVVLAGFYSVTNATYWLLLWPIAYDLAEVYEYKYNKRREASILSIIEFIAGIAAALGAPILTVSLTAVGFDPTASAQTPETIQGISLVVLGIPAISFVIGAILSFMNPLTKKGHGRLLAELEKKKTGQEPDESGLERII